MRVLALDPGVTTGLVLAEVLTGESMYSPTFQYDTIENERVMNPRLHVIEAEQPRFDTRDMLKYLHEQAPDEIVCESFEFRQGKAITGADLTSKEIIGVVKTYAMLKDVPLHFQTAAVGKGHFTDEKLRENDMWFVGKHHARDAARHLLYWFSFGPGSRFQPELKA